MGGGKDLDIAALIQQIQSPLMTRIGVLDVESFFAAGDRFSCNVIEQSAGGARFQRLDGR